MGPTVLLVGGNSGAGKTTVARALAARRGMAWTQADDVRLALQRVTTPTQQPALHRFLGSGVWRAGPEELRDALVAVGEVVSHALEIVVANHLASPEPVVLEGDGILPAMAARHEFAGVPAGGRVRAVFLVVNQEAEVLAAMAARGRGWHEFSAAEREVQARTSALYGRWLAEEAGRRGLPVVAARPWASLVERVEVALEPPESADSSVS